MNSDIYKLTDYKDRPCVFLTNKENLPKAWRMKTGDPDFGAPVLLEIPAAVVAELEFGLDLTHEKIQKIVSVEIHSIVVCLKKYYLNLATLHVSRTFPHWFLN